MQILLGIIVGAIVGLALHYLLPHRASRGVAVAPIIGAAASAVVWTILTWVGFAVDNPWLWLAAVVAPVIVVIPLVLALAAGRARHDAAERARLRIG